MKQNKKLIVIGGGAAGFFCAVNAARLDPNLEVQLFEKSDKLLSKVKISGGGRCNVTHAADFVYELIPAYPRGKNFVKKTLHQFPPAETVAWFNQRGVDLKVEPDGRMFPVSDQSQTIVDCLIKEAEMFKVSIHLKTDVKSIAKIGEGFNLTIQSGGDLEKRVVEADFVCVAAGGHPKLTGFLFLSETGHNIITPAPSLFTFNIADKNLHELMGIAVKDCIVRIPELKLEESGPVLITHWGLSGPAILKLSARAARDLNELEYQFKIAVNWISNYHESSALEMLKSYRLDAKHEVNGKNPFGLTTRLWMYLIGKAGLSDGMRWKDTSNPLLVSLSKVLTADQYSVSGKTTFKEEFVTAGGVNLKEINSLTMESLLCKGLFFAGEVMDVDGITGGYNFQHAWSSGWIAAKSITSVK
jgi:predicted Rossmann fold flavoprotein